MKHAYVMLEWCTPAVGRDVVLAAVTNNPHLVPETVHPLLGFSNSSDGTCESEVHFTVGLPDTDDALSEFCDSVRARGHRVKTGMIIPSELARSDADTVFAYENAESERSYQAYLADRDAGAAA